jgi:hypothetical protein
LIIRIIFGAEYGSLSSSLCSILHSPLASSLLGLNTLLPLRPKYPTQHPILEPTGHMMLHLRNIPMSQSVIGTLECFWTVTSYAWRMPNGDCDIWCPLMMVAWPPKHVGVILI